MDEVTIYHNPRCSKSRQALALLEERGITPQVVRYLDSPPSKDEIAALLAKLSVSPREMMRTTEAVYKELGLKDADEAALMDAMAAHPILIERPIVVKGNKAVIARPPEALLNLI